MFAIVPEMFDNPQRVTLETSRLMKASRKEVGVGGNDK